MYVCTRLNSNFTAATATSTTAAASKAAAAATTATVTKGNQKQEKTLKKVISVCSKLQVSERERETDRSAGKLQ